MFSKFLLNPPAEVVDVILDTDAYNEIDDQFAIAYLLRNKDRLNTLALYAAPFHNTRCESPEDGMQKSYEEIFHILSLCGENVPVFSGSTRWLDNETTPVLSPAAQDLSQRAMAYTPAKPLYVVAIGAITNIASALILNPAIRDRIIVVWLGGHAHHWDNTKEFNMRQDYKAARVVMGSGVRFVQLPCCGVVSEFRSTQPELMHWLADKNPLADYLARNTVAFMNAKSAGKPWSKVIWDVTAIAWLLNDDERFLKTRVCPIRLPGDDGLYGPETRLPMVYVYGINRDALMEDLIQKLLS